ncbi:uncharacterized protein LOC142349670 isoform X2 [Convolutriloba macropyga]|uniref:uncharacterized protein LOC142349670 isoform X2 n=1 Tax=Convolutriloba macropyga TaxID=536237 RepID=UPI003F51F9B8
MEQTKTDREKSSKEESRNLNKETSPGQTNDNENNQENDIYTNENGIGEDPVNRGESSKMNPTDPPTIQKNPEPKEEKEHCDRESSDVEISTGPPDSNNENDGAKIDDLLSNVASSRQGSGQLTRDQSASAKDISSVNGGTRISKVDRPNESSPLNQQIQDGPPPIEQEQQESNDHNDVQEINLTSNQPYEPNQKRVQRRPRYTFKTFDDCPCAFCRPKPKREKEFGKDGKGGKSGENGDDEGEEEGSGTKGEDKIPKKPPTPQPIVIPKTQTEVQIVNGKGGVSIDSEKAVTDIPQNFKVQRIMDYSSVQKSSLLWRIENVSQKKRAAECGETVTIYSTPFYTAQHGYRIMAATCLFGTGSSESP